MDSGVSTTAIDLKAFLRAVFPAYKGSLIFTDEGATENAFLDASLKSMLTIEEWFEKATGPVLVGPPDDALLDASLFCLWYPADHDGQLFNASLPASFVMERDNGERVVGYLPACDKADFAKLFDKMRESTLGRKLSVDTPLPGKGWTLRSPSPFPRCGASEIEIALETFARETPPANNWTPDEEPTERINDAKVYGVISDDLANHPIVISTAKGQFEKVWKTQNEAPFLKVFEGILSTHKEGKKDGPAFVTGALGESGKRTKTNVTASYMIGLDVDSGASMDEAFAAVRKAGLTAIQYTTHSHGTTRVEIAHDRFYNWCEKRDYDSEEVPTTARVREFMRAETHYVDSIIESAEYEDTIHDDGIKLIVRTKPIDKWRMVFPLAKPFIYKYQKGSHKAVIDAWSAKALGLGRKFGVEIDRAARDPSRLWYLPRHDKKKDNWTIRLSAGDLLNFDDIAAAYDKGKQSDNPFSQVGDDLGGKETVWSPGGEDLTEWEKRRARSFDIANVFRDHAEDRIRKGKDDPTAIKLTVECPFDSSHSEPGNPEDMGCIVQSADKDAFVFKCQHNSCNGLNRLQMLSKAFEVFEIPETVLKGGEYDLRPDDEREEDEAESKNLDSAKEADTAPPRRSGGLVRIRKGIPFEQRREELRKAVVEANSVNPTVFQTKGMMRRVDAYGELEFVDKLKFKAVCNKAATYVEKVKNLNDGDPVLQPDIDFLMGCGDRLFPELAGVRNTPVHSAKGTLRTTSGYDPDTQYLYQLEGIEIPPVSPIPSEDELREAVSTLINDVLGDFPFSDDIAGSEALVPFENGVDRIGSPEGRSSRAHALCAILHDFTTNLFEGPSPAYFFEKPEAGTGASLLAEVVAMITTGRRAAMQTLAKPEELRKELLAKIVKGRRLIVLDNIPESGLRGDVLASFITSGYISGRVLGSTEDVEAEVTTQLVITGNHVEMEDDFVRRMLAVYLNAGVENPKERKGFRHPKLLKWIKANRPKIIWACLTLVQNYIAQNPDRDALDESDEDSAFASFEEYAEVMGGVLKAAGIDGFLENQKQFKATKEQGSQSTKDVMQAIFDMKHAPGYDGKFPDVDAKFWEGKKAIDLSTADIAPVIYEDGLCKFAAIDKSDRKRSDGSIINSLSRKLTTFAGKRYKVTRTLPEIDAKTKKRKTSSVNVSFGMETDSATNKKVWLLRFIPD